MISQQLLAMYLRMAQRRTAPGCLIVIYTSAEPHIKKVSGREFDRTGIRTTASIPATEFQYQLQWSSVMEESSEFISSDNMNQ